MKERFFEYLKKSGASSEVLNRRFFNLYHEVCRLLPEEQGEIFLEKSRSEPSIASDDSLWFFSSSHAVEARRFADQEDLEVFSLAKLRRLRVFSENFNWEKLKPEPDKSPAILRVEAQPAVRELISLKASGDQCGLLGLIVLNYLKTHL